MRVFVAGPRLFGGLFRLGVSVPLRWSRARSPRVQTDFVYVIAGNHGLTKIGISADPAARLATLQTGSPFRLRIAHVAPAGGRAYEVEQEAHAILSSTRQSGEWFAVSPEMAISAVYAASERTGVSLTGESSEDDGNPALSALGDAARGIVGDFVRGFLWTIAIVLGLCALLAWLSR